MRVYSYIDPGGQPIKSYAGHDLELHRLYEHLIGAWPWEMDGKQYRLLRLRVPEAAQGAAAIEIMVEEISP